VSLTHCGSGDVQGFDIHPRLSTDGLHALRNAAIQGLGAALGSAWAMQADLAAGRLVHLAPQWRADALPVYLVYAPSRFQPARLRRFIEIMREHLPAELEAGLAGGGRPVRG